MNLPPSADGYRNTVFNDGIRFYEHLIVATPDSLQKRIYVDSIFMLYDHMEICYPSGGLVPARKGFDLFYKYPYKAKNRKEIYHYFIKAIELDTLEADNFILRPLAELIVELFDANEIGRAEAYKYVTFINERLIKGLEECKGVQCAMWEIVEEHVPKHLLYFERLKGFYPCEYYMEKYYPRFEAKPKDCDIIRTVYSYLKFAECDEYDERLKQLVNTHDNNCTPRPSSGTPPPGNYAEQIEYYKKAIKDTGNISQKASYTLSIAKVYEIHLRNFPKAREWALKAVEIRPNWGEPYILIGRMYISSGPLCGPGRGWDSQVVIYPAIDIWEKAKVIDPTVAEEADQWINKYLQYAPTKLEAEERGLKIGDPYYVGCWIQRSTKIRASNKTSQFDKQ